MSFCILVNEAFTDSSLRKRIVEFARIVLKDNLRSPIKHNPAHHERDVTESPLIAKANLNSI